MIAKDKIELAELIARLMRGETLSTAEEDQLKTLMELYPSSKSYFDELLARETIQTAFDYRKLDMDHEWSKVLAKQNLQETELQENIVPFKRKPSKWQYVAAAASIVMLFSFFWMITQEKKPLNQEISKVETAHNPPLSGAVTLQVDGGDSYALSGHDASNLPEGMAVTGKELKYQQSNNAAYNPTHQLNVPYQNTISLILSDGTRVSVNANTQMTYQSKFTGNERRIKLRGQAYFDVAKDAKRPFIIETEQMEIQAIGTQFDVNVYSNNAQVNLLEGEVKVSSQGKELAIKAGEKVISDGVKMGKTKIENIEAVTAWRDGRFFFANQSIGQVLNEISRWYGITIDFKATRYNHKRYTGGVDKALSLEEVCKVLGDLTNYRYKIEGGKIIVLD